MRTLFRLPKTAIAKRSKQNGERNGRILTNSRESSDSSSLETNLNWRSAPSHVCNNVSYPGTSVAYSSEDDIGLVISYYRIYSRESKDGFGSAVESKENILTRPI